MRPFFTAAFAFCLPLIAIAQTSDLAPDDRSYLTALLEDSLSGAGRKITITGFTGALSSQASLQELTIADDQGIWITLRDVSLDWSRSDLLTGRVTVNSLAAGEIDFARMPTAEAKIAPEASSFSLPDLPVAVNIGALSAEKIILGEPILGEALTATLTASLALEGGQGSAVVALHRNDDGPKSDISLTASYASRTENLAVDLAVTEGKGGVISKLIGIVGAPETDLTILGDGPLSDWLGHVSLNSDGIERLGGDVELTRSDAGASEFSAHLSGDMTPLFLPEYHDFFGREVELDLQGGKHPGGNSFIRNLTLKTRSMQISGNLEIGPSGIPEQFSLNGKIEGEEGRPVLLPLTTDLPVSVKGAKISAQFDAAKGKEWGADLTLDAFQSGTTAISTASIKGTGLLLQGKENAGFDGQFAYSAEGFQPANLATATALGSVFWGETALAWREGDGKLTLQSASFHGDGYKFNLTGALSGLSTAFAFDGALSANLDNIAQFSGLVGYPISGAAQLDFRGAGSPLTGAFDAEGQVKATDLAAGIPQVDGVLAGMTTLSVSAQRNTDGLALRSLTLQNDLLNTSLKGHLSNADSSLVGNFHLKSIAPMGEGYSGDLAGTVSYTGTLQNGLALLDATGSSLAIGQPQLDPVIGGKSTLHAKARLQDGAIILSEAMLKNGQIEGRLEQSKAGNAAFEVAAKLKNFGLIVPEFPGAVSLTGRANLEDLGAKIDISITGPGRLAATAKGQYSSDGRNNLAIKGTAQAGLINAFVAPRSLSGDVQFDIGLRGALALESLSGTASLAKGRLSDPSLPFVLTNVTSNARLANGKAALSGSTGISTGGTAKFSGGVALEAPFTGDLKLDLSEVRLRDPALYDAKINGAITIDGPLLGGAKIQGAIDLGRTELLVPASSFDVSEDLPNLVHFHDTAGVQETRRRAGIGAAQLETRGSGGIFELDVRVRAPNRIFIRGRGLEAELGGEMRLQGTTDDIRPAGAFSLVQGRFQILSKRLELEEVLLQMEGQLIPQLKIRAVNNGDSFITAIEIDGPAIDPDIHFTSSPELPEEEVLAQLLFEQNVQNLSALQGLQLASAIATLAGKGGEGAIGKLRKKLRLDTLDIQIDDAGKATFAAGKYLSEKVYSEVTIGPKGEQELNLNLDVTDQIKVHTSTNSEGKTGLGFDIEKNY